MVGCGERGGVGWYSLTHRSSTRSRRSVLAPPEREDLDPLAWPGQGSACCTVRGGWVRVWRVIAARSLGCGTSAAMSVCHLALFPDRLRGLCTQLGGSTDGARSASRIANSAATLALGARRFMVSCFGWTAGLVCGPSVQPLVMTFRCKLLVREKFQELFETQENSFRNTHFFWWNGF